jgi:hypothetical protein
VWGNGVLVTARLKSGEISQAWDAVVAIEEALASSSGIGFMAAHGVIALAEFYLTVWESGRSQFENRDVPAFCERACRALSKYARRYWSVDARANLWDARRLHLNGRSAAAYKAALRSLRSATRFSMPFEEGLAHYEIARSLARDEADRDEHRARAQAVFTELGATLELAGVKAL